MAIHTIEFHVDNHLVQVTDDLLVIFRKGNVKKPGVMIDVDDMARIIQIAREQIAREEGE